MRDSNVNKVRTMKGLRWVLLCSLVTILAIGCRSAPQPADEEEARVVETGGTTNVDAIREFERAVELWIESDGQDLDGVRRHLDRALREDRRFGIAWYNLGVLDELEGDISGARRSYERALEHAPRLGSAHVNIGMLDLADGDRDAAWDRFQQSVEVQPFNAAAHNNISVILRDAGEYSDAIAHARRSLAGDSQNTRAYANLARVYFDQGNHQVARLVIENALLINDQDADLYNIRGMIELENDEVTQAIINFSSTLDLDPNHIPALLNLGAIVLNTRDYERGRELFGRVLAQEEDHREALIATAFAYRGLGDLAEARRYYEKVLEQDPQNAVIQFNLAVLEHEHLAQNAQLGMDSEPADPDDPVAMMDWTIDNLQTSITHYERAIEHYRSFIQYEQGRYPDRREEANARIDQVREIITVTQEQLPMLREQRDMLAAELGQ